MALTIASCASMSAMGGIERPGGWTMSMAWMRMPGQTWSGAAASFLGMWLVMMVAMMLPSLVPMLWRYRRAVGGRGEKRLGRLTALAGVGYFSVWTVSPGIIIVINSVLGSRTPPVGILVFICASIAKVPANAVFRECNPFLIACGIGLNVITYVPASSLTLWKLIGH